MPLNGDPRQLESAPSGTDLPDEPDVDRVTVRLVTARRDCRDDSEDGRTDQNRGEQKDPDDDEDQDEGDDGCDQHGDVEVQGFAA